MKRGALIALAMIYIVFAWVFGSYGWPLVVMAIILIGVVDALFGRRRRRPSQWCRPSLSIAGTMVWIHGISPFTPNPLIRWTGISMVWR